MGARTVAIVYVEKDEDGGMDVKITASDLSPANYVALDLGLGGTDILLRADPNILQGLFESALAALAAARTGLHYDEMVRLGNEVGSGSTEPF